jgi:hypothetical protein
MTISDLVTELIEDILDDTQRLQGDAEARWSDAKLTRYAKEAIKELCSRSSVLIKNTTVSVVANTSEYQINANIRQIFTAALSLSDYPLIQATADELAIKLGRTWRLKTGTPTHFVRENHKITLYPKPIVNDTLTIKASHIPATADYEADLALIDPAYHKTLLYYMAYKSLLTNDADAGLQAEAANYLAMFEKEAGSKSSIHHEQFIFNTPTYGANVPARMC